MCGSDPVRIVQGTDNHSAMRSAERRTLDRLGLIADHRMACVTRVQGVGRDRRAPGAWRRAGAGRRRGAAGDCARGLCRSRGGRRVVVVGAGVAGVTAAEELRNALPDAAPALVGEEPYDFYNRMAITRLVSKSASIDSLYLNPRDWAESRRINYRRGEETLTLVVTERVRTQSGAVRRLTDNDAPRFPSQAAIV
jgi:NADPH-dependent 2,4-dienoyl-CoA reductase/sulfur reductase-like enzyme